MRHRTLVSLALGAVTALLWHARVPVAAQSQTGGAPIAAAATSTTPRTPWGDPDLQGVWDYWTFTPLERPKEFAGKAVLTDEEAARLGERLRDLTDVAPACLDFLVKVEGNGQSHP